MVLGNKRIIIKCCGRGLVISLNYFKENWGALFIIGFQVMLVYCALLVVWGYEAAANEVAVYAFYSLVLGVFLQFFSYLRHGEGEGDE